MQNAVKKMNFMVIALVIVMAIMLVCSSSSAAGGGVNIGNFGPTGVEITVQKDLTMKVTGIQSGSPAEGKFEKGHIITTINGKKLLADPIQHRGQLSDFITNGAQQWSYYSFEPKEKLEKSNPNRYRKATMPAELEGWNTPEYDPSKCGWKTGKAVIGDKAPAGYRRPEKWHKKEMKEAGEVIFFRKTFEVDDLDYVMFRQLYAILSRKGG